MAALLVTSFVNNDELIDKNMKNQNNKLYVTRYYTVQQNK